MPDIKIFVSHRIDIDSELIDNSLYVPVRCGAVFDRKNPMGIAGDDTGENISDRRMSFCEFTVQYWAWKNVKADYYGLCHYRRYLSFSGKHFKTDEYGLVPSFFLDKDRAGQFGLSDSKNMENVIGQYDMLIPEAAPLDRYPTPKGCVRTVRELWLAHENILITGEAIEKMFSLIDELSPEYSVSAREYFESDRHRGYNCFVMKDELFNRMCSFQFPIIFAMEEWLRTQTYRDKLARIPGYIGEMLFGIFTYHLTTRERWRTKELQLVLFKNTVPARNSLDRVLIRARHFLQEFVWKISVAIFPLGSDRRVAAKKFWYRAKTIFKR